MNFQPFLILALTGMLMLSTPGCRQADTPEVRTVQVPAGTPVKLVLLSTLTSGGSRVGSPVPMMVIEDVQVDGASVIKAGTIVEGKVNRSRGATAVTTLVNQPARLEAMLGTVETVDAQELNLSGRLGAQVEPFEFTLAGTSDIPSRRVTTLNPEEREALAQLVRELMGPSPEAVLEDRSKRERLRQMAQGAGLENLERSLRDVRSGEPELGTVVRALRAHALPNLIGPELALALTAVNELGNLTRSLDRGLRGIFRGRNIEAGEGMVITGYTSAPAQVTVPQPSTR